MTIENELSSSTVSQICSRNLNVDALEALSASLDLPQTLDEVPFIIYQVDRSGIVMESSRSSMAVTGT